MTRRARSARVSLSTTYPSRATTSSRPAGRGARSRRVDTHGRACTLGQETESLAGACRAEVRVALPPHGDGCLPSTGHRAVVPLPPRRADHPPGRPRSGRRGVGREPPPRQARQSRLAASSLGARRGRCAHASVDRPRPRPLPGHPRAARHDRGQTHRRPQNRQTSLPRPARARARHNLTRRIGLDALPVPPEPGSRRLPFGMSRHSPPQLDNLRRNRRAPR
jgi:hypothetical protein